MIDWLLVLPVIDPKAAAAWASCFDGDPARVVVVNNSGQQLGLPWTPGALIDRGGNLGVAASWNAGARKLIRERRDVLVLCSTSVRFRDGGVSLLDALERCDRWGVDFVTIGWHVIAFTQDTFRTVGLFDEGFWPAYSEDTDFLYRMHLCGAASPRDGTWLAHEQLDADDEGQAVALQQGLVEVSLSGNVERYREKWGGDEGCEQFVTPWDTGMPSWWW